MKKTCLIILDGWGIAPPGKGNAIAAAHPKHFNNLFQENPHLLLNASGTAVGLLPGYIGNSEVGHLHIGAGRLVKQDLVRIFDSYKKSRFLDNKVLVNAMKKAKGKTLHLLGLVSDGGVHSHIRHLFGLLELAKHFKLEKVFVHAITDGRDVPPKSAEKYLRELEKKMLKLNKNWKIATVSGRFYAMDRDNRWQRTKKAYDALVSAQGRKAESAAKAVKQAYKKGETDEFIEPTVIEPKGKIKTGDTVIFFNFRADRARQLAKAFTKPSFSKFRRKKVTPNFVCMASRDPEIKAPAAFPPPEIKNSLGEVISKNGLRQFRLAETEKWAHVTFFFNGLSPKVFPKEDRKLIPSPKVRTYDKTPAMSAYKITKEAMEVFASKKKYSFVLINFANPDMVGHTGDFNAAVKAVKAVDECLAYTVNSALQNNFDVLVTADHGNAEKMLYPDGSICTAHTTNKVPFIVISKQKTRWRKIKKPCLYHIAPTVLQLIGIEKPKEMTKGLLR